MGSEPCVVIDGHGFSDYAKRWLSILGWVDLWVRPCGGTAWPTFSPRPSWWESGPVLTSGSDDQ